MRGRFSDGVGCGRPGVAVPARERPTAAGLPGLEAGGILGRVPHLIDGLLGVLIGEVPSGSPGYAVRGAELRAALLRLVM
jgi:hypothetical protein